MNNTCVTECPDAKEAMNGVCPACDENEYLDTTANTCGVTCPDSAPLKDDDFICKACARGEFYNPMTNECVGSCQTDLKSESGSICKTCAEKYTEESDLRPNWNTMTETCVKECPDEKDVVASDCPACDAGKYLDMENNECVDSCPYARPLAKDSVCTACESGKMFSANEDGCVAPGEPGCVRKAIIDGE